MDINSRTPQPGMRPHDSTPPRPQGYNNPHPRPSVDGVAPPPAPSPSQPSQAGYPQTPAGPAPQYGQPAPLQNHPNPEQTHPIAPQGPQVLEPTHDHHHSSKPVILAIITLLIAAGLAVAAFFAFRPETADKVNKVNVPTNSSKEPDTSTSTTPAQEADSATSDINKQVEGLNDSTDFADSELSDQTLGL